MLDFYYWPTPNGWKVSIFLEELGIDYNMIPLNIGKGDQFNPDFLKLNPNHRMPVIVDHDVEGDPVPVFESGAILWYLANKTGQFLPSDPLLQKEILEWLFWQTGNQGPMAGQLSHFVNYAPKDEVYGQTRYANEYDRCLGVMERRLSNQEFLVGDEYTIADIISWPWVLIAKPLGQKLDDFANLSRWRNAIKARPAVQRGVDLEKELRNVRPHTNEERKNLFNQTAKTADRTNLDT